ncbi:YLP motif-containing protein 1 isoform X1 [Frankliniella occidentalis]|uniref:Regulation of nuclear pre-mRNA domain-containing protein 2 n=1 Tax=Frankliniella occidentalis TaxID=133901 RepID=A0A6J1S5A4_FRAOC|nr:YLP motif-containing protein 1 isoform X1 [Frankliniella occidentalis]
MSVFNDQAFEKKLLGLKDSQESISTLSDWCLQHKQHHKKIVATWLSVLKKVRVENRLTLFYLANDVIQYSKRKNYDFVESWGTALQKATTMVRHDKVMIRIMRIFKIWGERNVYNEEFLTDLRGLLTAKKATPATPQAKPSDTPTTAPVATSSTEFNASNLFDRMHRCKDLEDDTDLKLKVVNDCKLVNFNDLEAFRTMLKDRKHADGVAGELDDAISQVEAYRKALEIEISERKTVIDLLQQGSKFYETEKNDARVVFNAYRNFSSRVKSLKRKLDELIPTLSSPVPSPDVNAPSPSPDSDIDLPNDDDLSGKLMQNTRRVSPPPRARTQGGDMDNMPNCFSSFMGGGALPFDIKSNFFVDDGSNRANILGTSEDEPEGKPIEVIGRRKEERYEIFTNFLNNLTQGAPSSAKPNSSAIPGLGDPLPVPPPSIPSDYRLPSSSPTPLPIPPPPMPPLFDNFSQENCEKDDSWNTSLPPKFPTWRDTASSNWSRDDPNPQDGGEWMPALPVPKVPPPPLPQNLETPESPPSFEKESFRQPVEYDDTVHNRKSDVDHRSFLSHSSSPKDVDHRILNNRFKKDVDHRNLISLTGSPRELQPPPLPPNLWGDVDQDYRTPPPSKQQSRPGDNVESVDMEMSDEEEIERHQDKGRSREHSPSKKSVGGSQAPESPIKDREELGKSRSPHLPNPSKTTPQRFNVPPPTTRPPFPPPPRPLFPDAQFAPSLGGDFNKFSMPPIPPPPALPLSGPPPGLPLRLRHPGMNFLPPNLTLPPNPLLAIQNRSPVPAALVAQRTLEASPSHSMPTSTTQQVTPSGTQSSGPEESDTESIGQYLNMGLSDDEEIKEMVASMDPQLLQEVVDGINIGNGSDKLDLSSLMPNNGEIEEGDGDWNGQGDFVDPNNRGRPWKPSRLSVPGTPPGLAMPHPSMSPGAPRFRGHGLNWRSPPMHERGGRGRGFYRPFRGRGPPMPRQPYGGNW